MDKQKLISLVVAAQKGDTDAVNALFEAFYNDVYYFALKTIKDSDTACDITQETFLEIIKTIGNLKEPAAFATWMKQVAYHQCTRYFKKKKDVLVEEDEDGNTIFDDLVDESEGSIPSEVYEKEEFRSTILGIINELSEEQRSAVMMYYYDELSVGQIAQIQRASEGTVKSRLNYARKAIKRSVEEYEKKHNIKLHSVALLPLLMLFFGKELMPKARAAEIGAVVSESASAMGAGAAAGTGIAVKTAPLPLATKIVAGVAAAAVAVGIGVALFTSSWHDCIDLDGNLVCDACGAVYDASNANDPKCDGSAGGRITCDEDGDLRCDQTNGLLCDENHWNCHFEAGPGDGKCDACGSSVIAQPKVFMAEDVLCILPGMVMEEGQGAAYDQVDSEFEIYDLDTGKLLCTRSRWDVGEGLIPGVQNGQRYNVGNEAFDAAIKIHISELTDASVCNLGVRAKSLDENYASTGFTAARYVAVSELKPLNVTVDGSGILRIGNYNADCIYRVYDVSNPECPVEVWFNMGGTLNLREILGSESFLTPPQDGRYLVQVYETNDYADELCACSEMDIPVLAVWGSYHGNHETVEFYVTTEEYWAAKEAGSGPEPVG